MAYPSSGEQVAVLVGDSSNYVLRGALLERFQAVEVPLTGNAQYRGVYSGLAGNRKALERSGGIFILVTGDVGIDVNFEMNTLSGEIKNRLAITFEETALNGALRF